MTEWDWDSEVPDEDSGAGGTATATLEPNESDDMDPDLARRRQLLEDQIDVGGPMTAVFKELLFLLDERVAKQKAEEAAAKLLDEEPELDVKNDPRVQDALRADMARRRADADALVMAESVRQWQANGLTPSEIASKVEELKAQQAQLSAYETGNAGSPFDGPDAMRDHPVWRAHEQAAWEAERGRLGAAEFRSGWDEDLAEAEAEMRKIIQRAAARR